MPRRQVKLSLNDGEYKDLVKMAKDARMPLSTFVKEVVFTMNKFDEQFAASSAQPTVAGTMSTSAVDFQPIGRQDWLNRPNTVAGTTAQANISASSATQADENVILLSDVLLDKVTNSDQFPPQAIDSYPNIATESNSASMGLPTGESAKLNFNLGSKRKVEININM